MRKLLLVMFMIIFLASCTPQKQIVEVPVETIRTEYIHNLIIDSVYEKDSTDRYRSGDTLYIYKERIKYQYLNKIDTVLKTDTIPKIIQTTVTKEVKVNYVTWYQKLLMWSGGISLLLLAGLIIYRIKQYGNK